MPPSKETIPVLIVGGGPVGLSLSLALARQGIASMVVEKHPTTTRHPKARGVNTRSMELFRQWGVEEAMRTHQMPPEARRFIWLESLQGEEITRVSAKSRDPVISPTTTALISQDWVEEELFKEAARQPLIHLAFNTLAADMTQDDTGVDVMLEQVTDDVRRVVRADWVVAADGASSPVRNLLGITMQGVENLGEFCNIFCEMDLSRWVGERPSVGFIFTREDVCGTFLLSKDGEKYWLVGVHCASQPELAREEYSDAACRAFIERLIDDSDISVRIINKAFWTMAALVADTWRVGRVLLAGDAAHRLPPTGGLGMNTGVQDAHNLAWKLAMVLKHQAESSLLDTYMAERAPVCRTNIAWSTRNSQRMTTIFQALSTEDYATMTRALDEQQEHMNQLALDIGFCYTEGCVLPEPGKHAPSEGDNYQPSTLPGVRAPHCWLTRGGETLSTLDLFEKTFVLLCTDATDTWQKAVATLKDAPLVCYRIGKKGDLQDKDGHWQSLYQTGEYGAVLVRPDGHVAWRSTDGVSDAGKTLETVWKTLMQTA